jgi:hypothetical protein
VEACAAPPAPVALLDTPYVSSPVQAMPGMKQLAQEHRLFTEQVTQRQTTAAGTKQIAVSTGDVSGGQQPGTGTGVALPVAPWPTSPSSKQEQKQMWKLAGQAANVAVQVIPALYQTFTEGIDATAQQAWGCAAYQNLADCGWTALNIIAELASDGEGAPLTDITEPVAEDNIDMSSWVSPPRPKTYQTYVKHNPETGQYYAGKTSGYGTPRENVAQRDYGHAYNKKGFGPAQLDQSSANEDAIKGREQMLIDYFVSRGVSGNYDKNPVVTNREYYIQQAISEFGPLP